MSQSDIRREIKRITTREFSRYLALIRHLIPYHWKDSEKKSERKIAILRTGFVFSLLLQQADPRDKNIKRFFRDNIIVAMGPQRMEEKITDLQFRFIAFLKDFVTYCTISKLTTALEYINSVSTFDEFSSEFISSFIDERLKHISEDEAISIFDILAYSIPQLNE